MSTIRAVAAWLLAFTLCTHNAHASLRVRDESNTDILLHNVQTQRCPQACEYAGTDPATWTSYHDWNELSLCNETILFTFNVHGLALGTHFKACLTEKSGAHMQAGAYYGLLQNNVTDIPTPYMITQHVLPDTKDTMTSESEDESCGAVTQQSTIELRSQWAGQGTGSAFGLSTIISQLQQYLRNSANCGRNVIFARSPASIVVGIFTGGDLVKASIADLIELQIKDIPEANNGGFPAQYTLQAVRPSLESGSKFQLQADKQFGLFVDLNGNLPSVQTFLSSYISSFGKGIDVDDMSDRDSTIHASVRVLASSSTLNSSSISSPSTKSSSTTSLERRALCRDIQVVSGDGCGSLASKCGISGADFTKYNSKTPNLCSALKAKQYVCCSTGDLPDHTPQPGGDGICASYQVQPDDGCKSIADSFGINVTRIIESNKKSWGFRGCDTGMLQKGQIICLSRGDPPMPASNPSAICGPQVVGSQRPSDWDDISKLNPCPINACCDVWGQCGTTEEFCIPSSIDSHPGTAKPNTNGCISNCGTDIINNDKGPTSFSKIGYFEAFNKERECLHMDITQLDVKKFTHIHFAFATISSDYKVLMAKGVKEQFDKMVHLDSKGAKKILSFGGWSFSTDHDTSPIFATGVSDANRELFATNVVQFLKDNKLDGLDFDWEYPGATDIEGAVPGSTHDGPNYYNFLKSVRKQLPEGKSLSIALPASYWYLRGFPLVKMAPLVDYFIYMTYDLHGQWDYGSKSSNPGCKTGNCLRSHVNKTETRNALSMVTKAGVPSPKIMVGVSSYGRSFKMVDAECTDVNCHFSGTPKLSEAEPGTCTGTAGYIADAEIEVIASNDGTESWFDEKSSSNIMTWNGNWVAYMDGGEKDSRTNWVKGLNFGGTSDWAIDLQDYHGPLDGDTSDGEFFDAELTRCDHKYADLEALKNDAANVPSACAPLYTIIAMDTLLNATLSKYDEVKNDYDGKFKYYEQYINDLVNPQIENWMDNFDKNEETKQGLGNRFFDCRYKHKGDDAHGDDSWIWEGACPVPGDIMNGSKAVYDPDVSWIIEYTLKDKDAYEKALGSELGIQPDWLQMEDWDGYDRCEGGTGGGGSGPHARLFNVTDPPDNTTTVLDVPCVAVDHIHKNFPRKKASITITDPKSVMESAIPTIDSVREQLKAAGLALALGMYNATLDPADSVTALSTPIQMLAQAVAHMEDVKDIGGEIEENKKKETILLIVSLVLMIVPFVSEVGFELAGFVSLARFAFVVGEVANGALAVVDIIDNPESAPFAVMGILAGAAAGKGAKGIEQTFADAAKARRALGDASVMGKRFKEIDDKVQAVMTKSCKR